MLRDECAGDQAAVGVSDDEIRAVLTAGSECCLEFDGVAPRVDRVTTVLAGRAVAETGPVVDAGASDALKLRKQR